MIDFHSLSPRPVVDTDGRAIFLDLSAGSMQLGEPLPGLSVPRFSELVETVMAEAQTGFAYGRWGERRELYSNALFANDDPDARRDVHLGVDVFCAPGTEVCAPLPGRVVINANNARELDYGPLLILQHETDSGSFFTLYGHLSLDSIATMTAGTVVEAGERIARVGSPPENGNWGPHLHFQPIVDLLGLGADFPGVARRDEIDKWFGLSPLPAAFFPDCDAAQLDGSDTVA